MFDSSYIHPLLVHFPITLTLLGVVLEGFSIFKPAKFYYPFGKLLLYLATLSALVATVSGVLFTPGFTSPELVHAKHIHRLFALITVASLCVTSAIYLLITFIGNNTPLYVIYILELRKTGFIFYIASAVLVCITGYLGVAIVYSRLPEI